MEKSFPVILCELRKEKGLSQKEAAAKLGISQALLSHYEKGIRECGQNFLVKVADFYGVTCDYLLGRAPGRISKDDYSYFFEIEQTDELPMRKTLFKAIGAVVSELSTNGSRSGLEFTEFISSQLYKLVLLEAQAGNLPPNWAGKNFIGGEVRLSRLYLALIDYAASDYIKSSESKNRIESKPMPEALKTIVQATEKHVLSSAIEKLPPIPLEMLK